MRFFVVSTFTTSVTSCSFGAESSPRPIPDRQIDSLIVPSGSQISLSGKARIYLPLFSYGSGTNLGSVARTVEPDELDVLLLKLLNELIAGPSTTEAATFGTAIPDGTEVLSISLTRQGATINLSGPLNQLPDDQLIVALAQIVYTMSEGFYIREVIIKIDGQNVEWPRHDGTRKSGPLTIFDYPTAAITSQPAYPGIISTESVA